MQISEKQVEAHISNLRGRLNYETKKATKLGFSTLQDYIKDKLIKEISLIFNFMIYLQMTMPSLHNAQKK